MQSNKVEFKIEAQQYKGVREDYTNRIDNRTQNQQIA